MFIAAAIAVLAALALFAAWLGARRQGLLVAAFLWIAYGGYEYLMYRRILCSGECNIRVDLLLIYPVLAAVSLAAAIAAAVSALRRRARPG